MSPVFLLHMSVQVAVLLCKYNAAEQCTIIHLYVPNNSVRDTAFVTGMNQDNLCRLYCAAVEN